MITFLINSHYLSQAFPYADGIILPKQGGSMDGFIFSTTLLNGGNRKLFIKESMLTTGESLINPIELVCYQFLYFAGCAPEVKFIYDKDYRSKDGDMTVLIITVDA